MEEDNQWTLRNSDGNLFEVRQRNLKGLKKINEQSISDVLNDTKFILTYVQM